MLPVIYSLTCLFVFSIPKFANPLKFWCFQKQKKNSGEEEETAGGLASSLVKVKNKYKDVDDYIATYEPLIFEEAKSQIIKEKEDEEGILNFNNFAFFFWHFSFTGLLF